MCAVDVEYAALEGETAFSFLHDASFISFSFVKSELKLLRNLMSVRRSMKPGFNACCVSKTGGNELLKGYYICNCLFSS